MIVDSTHTNAKYNQLSAREVLINYTKLLRKEVYGINDDIAAEFPKKTNNGILDDEIEYSKELLKIIKTDEVTCKYPIVKERLDMVEEYLDDINKAKKISKDENAKVGYKSADTSFFGYKTHIAMTE